MGNWHLRVELTVAGGFKSFEAEQVMSLDLFLQEAKLNQTKPDLKVRNIYRDGKFIVKSCSCILIDRIEFSVSDSFKFNVWICTALLKTRIFIWLAIQNRLRSRVFFMQPTSFILAPVPQIDTMPICMEIMNTIYFVVGFFWCVPITLDELQLQWSMMLNGKFGRKTWKLFSYGITCSI